MKEDIYGREKQYTTSLGGLEIAPTPRVHSYIARLWSAAASAHCWMSDDARINNGQ